MSNERVSRSRRTLILATLAGATSPALSMAGKPVPEPFARPGAALATSGGRMVLSGRVLSPDGTPVRGARLELAHETSPVLTDADGRFLWTGTLPRRGLLQCSLRDEAGEACRVSADLWLARQPDEPYQLHASQDQDGVWRVGLSLQQAA